MGVEVLVLDGGSTDNTLEQIESARKAPAFLRSHKDSGQAAAINEGLSRSSGDWLAFQNSDDFYMPGAISLVSDFINSANAEGIDLILGGTVFVDEQGEVQSIHYQKPISRLAMARRNYIHNQSMFISRSLFEKIGGLDPNLKFCLDYEWFLRILKQDPKIKIFKRILGAQRFHSSTKTSNMQDIHDEEFKSVRSKYFTSLEIALSSAWDPCYRAFRFAWQRIYA